MTDPSSTRPPRPLNELLAAMRAGDATAAREFCERMEPFLRRVSRHWLSPRVRRHADSQDVTQSVLRRVVKGGAPGDLTSEARVLAWAAAVVRNRVRTLARRPHDVGGDPVEAMIETGGGPAISNDPSDWAEQGEEVVAFQEAMKALSGDEQQVVVLHDFQGLEFEVVAQILGRPSGEAARKLHARAIERLRAILARDRGPT